MKPIQIYKMKDTNESHYVDKKLMFNLPFRLLIVGKSQLSGKSNLVANLLLQDDDRLYKKHFDGENIYIFSPSLKTDYKIKTLISEKDIPESNLFTGFDEATIELLYEIVKENYNDAINDKVKPVQSLFIFDDMSSSGDLKSKTNGIISKIFSNGRHILLSVVLTAQKYTDILTGARENCSGAILFSGTDRQLESISDDHNIMGKKDFKQIYREHTNKPHSFMVVNYSNPTESRYLDKNFEPIKY